MSDEKILTNEIAEQFLAEKVVALHEFEHIEDSAAESLSKHKGDLLLNGLTSLSDSAAESLSKHKGDLLLNGLTSLSDSAAESLSKHKGDIWLGGLTSLSGGPGHISLAERLSIAVIDPYFGQIKQIDSDLYEAWIDAPCEGTESTLKVRLIANTLEQLTGDLPKIRTAIQTHLNGALTRLKQNMSQDSDSTVWGLARVDFDCGDEPTSNVGFNFHAHLRGCWYNNLLSTDYDLIEDSPIDSLTWSWELDGDFAF